MKLIIDIPEEVYDALKGLTENVGSLDPYSLADIIINKSKPFEERPEGKWIDHSEDYGYAECPFCEHLTTCSEDNIEELNFCWYCGAKLRKGG